MRKATGDKEGPLIVELTKSPRPSAGTIGCKFLRRIFAILTPHRTRICSISGIAMTLDTLRTTGVSLILQNSGQIIEVVNDIETHPPKRSPL